MLPGNMLPTLWLLFSASSSLWVWSKWELTVMSHARSVLEEPLLTFHLDQPFSAHPLLIFLSSLHPLYLPSLFSTDTYFLHFIASHAAWEKGCTRDTALRVISNSSITLPGDRYIHHVENQIKELSKRHLMLIRTLNAHTLLLSQFPSTSNTPKPIKAFSSKQAFLEKTGAPWSSSSPCWRVEAMPLCSDHAGHPCSLLNTAATKNICSPLDSHPLAQETEHFTASSETSAASCSDESWQ